MTTNLDWGLVGCIVVLEGPNLLDVSQNLLFLTLLIFEAFF